MTKAILLALAAFIGSVLGVLGFLVIDSHIHLPFAVNDLEVWTEYGSLSFGGVRALFGVTMGQVTSVWKNKPQMDVPVPSQIPATDVAVRPRRNIRPLTWLYRA